MKDIHTLYQSLFNALSTESLDTITKALYEYCQYPVVVYDTLFNVLSLHPNHKINDPVWDSIYQQRQIPSEMLLAFTQDNMIKSFWNSTQPQLVNWGLLNETPRLVTAIRVDGNVVGSVGIVYKDKYICDYKEDAEALSLTAKALSIYFKQKNQYRATSQPLHDSFAVALLEGNVTTIDALRYWENVAGIRLENDIRVIVVACNTKEISCAVYNRIKEKVSSVFNTLMCSLNQYLYFIHYNLPHQSQSNYISKLNTVYPLLQFEDVSAGISAAIKKPMDIPLARYQAEQALKIGNASKTAANLFFYDDLAFDDILYSLKENPFFHSYIHPAIILLQESDKAMGNDYTLTLKVYLESFCSKIKTCQLLNIHRNTLSYRLEHIQKLTGIDLEDERTCRHIIVSYALLDSHFSPVTD